MEDVERGTGKVDQPSMPTLASTSATGAIKDHGVNISSRSSLKLDRKSADRPHSESINSSAQYNEDKTAVKEGSSENKSPKRPTDGNRQSKGASSGIKRYLKPLQAFFKPCMAYLNSEFAWIPANVSYSKLKPVLRCALVAWLSLLLFVIPSVERMLGQASFLIVIASFLSPPSDPFMSVLERETYILVFVALSWAWICVGIFLANLARTNQVPPNQVSFADAITGMYIEAGPTVIAGVFIFFGSAFFLYIKARKGPGPFLFACVYGCLSIDISLTTAVLFPYPFYTIGKAIMLPIALHSAIALLLSILVFPSTISTLFTTRLEASLDALGQALNTHLQVLEMIVSDPTPSSQSSPGSPVSSSSSDEDKSSDSSTFSPLLHQIHTQTQSFESSLLPLASAARLLRSDLAFSRFGPNDFISFQGMLRRLAGRADGLGIFYGIGFGSEKKNGVGASTTCMRIGSRRSIVGSRVQSRANSRPESRTSSPTSSVFLENEKAKPTATSNIGTGNELDLNLAQTSSHSRSFLGMVRTEKITSSGSVPPSMPVGLGVSSALLAPTVATLHGEAHSHRHRFELGSHSLLHDHDAYERRGFQGQSQLHEGQQDTAEEKAKLPSHPKTNLHHPHLHSSLLKLSLSGRSRPHSSSKSPSGSKNHHGSPDSPSKSQHNHPSTNKYGTIPFREQEQLREHEGFFRSLKSTKEHEVATFETSRYLTLENTRLFDPREGEWVGVFGELVGKSCSPLMKECIFGLAVAKVWLGGVRSGKCKGEASSWRAGLFVKSILVKKVDKVDGEKEGNGDSDVNLDSGSNEQLGKEENGPIKNDVAEDLDPLKPPDDFITRPLRERVKYIREVREKVARILEEFRVDVRHAVIEPYKKAFLDDEFEGYHNTPNPNPDSYGFGCGYNSETKREEREGVDAETEWKDDDDDDIDKPEEDYAMPPHRYLFNCYVYQYNLIQITSVVIEMLDEILKLEESKSRAGRRLWTPAREWMHNRWLIPEEVDDDDDPDIIQGLHHDKLSLPSSSPISGSNENVEADIERGIPFPNVHADADLDLGLPMRRDPDALPPHNILETISGLVYRFVSDLGGGNAIFAIKAGLLTIILCLPSLIKSSAEFAYENRFVWGIFMGQLTIARFRGDTAFGLLTRIISTFFGGIVGMVMWYISCGSSPGNAYGLCAVCAVCFPFFFFTRIYWAIPPMTIIVFQVTSFLVIGYSYQDVYLIIPGSSGFGWSVFWRRCVLVTAGVVAAYIASFLPPSTTIRRYERSLLATTSAELGTIYCSILSFANTKHEPEIQEIVSALIALRNKLGRRAGMRANVRYEFTLRGRWPAERYEKIADLQMGIAYALSHLMSVLEHLDPSWSRAFLSRTRFMDPDFQGDILAVISMISSSLRTGCPLPQITPCPLLDRFMLKYHGLNVIHKDAEEDYGLPRLLTLDTLQDEQYLMFSVGISTAFGIINRLDRLMVAVKEVVGEQYHIHGVGFKRQDRPR